MNWGDMLCGVEITPESWIGGVVEWFGDGTTGAWDIVRSYILRKPGMLHSYFITPQERDLAADLCTPVFPPRGFAGKSDAELCEAVFGSDYAVQVADGVRLHLFNQSRQDAAYGTYVFDGRITVSSTWRTADEMRAFIQAQNNALVLHARLTEAPHV